MDNGQTGDRSHCYTFQGRLETEASYVVTTGTFLVCDRLAFILFDLEPTFLYVSSTFTIGLICIMTYLAYLFIFLIMLVSLC